MKDLDKKEITRLMEAMDVKELTKEEQEELLIDLTDLVFESTMLRIIEKMDDQTKEEFSAMLDREADEEEIQAFLLEKVPGAESAVEEAMNAISSDILAVTKK